MKLSCFLFLVGAGIGSVHGQFVGGGDVTDAPTGVPSIAPTDVPSASPSTEPTSSPSGTPTFAPTAAPTLPLLTASGMYAKVLGQSGKVMLGQNPNPASDPNHIVIEFDGLYERDANGDMIGNTGNTKHSFNSFATQDFTFSELFEDQVGEARALGLNFTAELLGDATLTCTIYIFFEGGRMVLNGTETYDLQVGGFKYNIEIANWPFCETDGADLNDCGGDEGAFLDLDIAMKGSGSSAVKQGAKSYGLGSGISVDLSELVFVDGEWEDMEDSFPAYEQQGSKQIFTFRFPKFEDFAMYDPVVQGFNVTTTAPTASVEEEKVFGANGLYTDIKGQSGKIVIGQTENPNQDPDAVMVEIEGIYEMDSSNAKVSQNGHRYNSLANQEFRFSELYDTTLGEAEARALNLFSELDNGAVLNVTAFIITTDGDFTFGTETLSLKAGSFKFNVEIDGWPFLDDANTLDIVVQIKGKSDQVEDNTSTDGDYALGGDMFVSLSEQVQVDDQWQPLPESPTLTQEGGKQLFTFKFSKFERSAMYDPVVFHRTTEEQLNAAKQISCSLLLIIAIVAPLFL